MDDYPAGDPIPDPSLVNGQYRELVDFLSNSSEMRKTARSSMKQAAYAGTCALVGGMIMGPPGGMVGGIVGSVVGFIKADNYDGALMTLTKLDDDEKKVLLKRVGQAMIAAGASAQSLSSSDAFRDTLVGLAASKSVRDTVWKACVQSLQE